MTLVNHFIDMVVDSPRIRSKDVSEKSSGLSRPGPHIRSGEEYNHRDPVPPEIDLHCRGSRSSSTTGRPDLAVSS